MILTEPKNALVKQYQKLLEMDGVKLDFEPAAIDYIAQDLSFDINGIEVPFEIEDDVLTLTLQKPQSYYEDDSEDKYYYSMQYVIRTNVERLIQEN